MDPSGFELLQTAVLLLDGAGRIAYANGAAEELLGVSRRQLEGQLPGPYLEGLTSVLKTPLGGQPWSVLLEIPVHQAARLDDQQTDHDDAKSVISDLVQGLSEEYERRHR